MNTLTPPRPDPDALLSALKKEEERSKKAKLKIFFGMSAGVGKTYDMLKSAHEAKSKGIDVIIGYVETHRRPETEAVVEGLPSIPRKKVEYRGALLEEMDLDAILRAQRMSEALWGLGLIPTSRRWPDFQGPVIRWVCM